MARYPRIVVAQLVLLSLTATAATAQDQSPSRIDSITKSARDLVPSLPSISMPSMPDLSLPDFSNAADKVMSEFNSFTKQVGDTLPILESMGFEVVTFKVTWGLPPKARLRLKSKNEADITKIELIASKANSGPLMNALITSAATAKRIQSSMKLGTAFLDVDFAVPPRVNMKFVNAKTTNEVESLREDELEIACR